MSATPGRLAWPAFLPEAPQVLLILLAALFSEKVLQELVKFSRVRTLVLRIEFYLEPISTVGLSGHGH
jgi:hypothetical protein